MLCVSQCKLHKWPVPSVKDVATLQRTNKQRKSVNYHYCMPKSNLPEGEFYFKTAVKGVQCAKIWCVQHALWQASLLLMFAFQQACPF